MIFMFLQGLITSADYVVHLLDTSEINIAGSLQGESTESQWIPLTKSQLIRKTFPYHDVIMIKIYAPISTGRTYLGTLATVYL